MTVLVIFNVASDWLFYTKSLGGRSAFGDEQINSFSADPDFDGHVAGIRATVYGACIVGAVLLPVDIAMHYLVDKYVVQAGAGSKNKYRGTQSVTLTVALADLPTADEPTKDVDFSDSLHDADFDGFVLAAEKRTVGRRGTIAPVDRSGRGGGGLSRGL